MKKLDKLWFQAAFVRAIKTVAQAMLSMITIGAAFYEINWTYILSVAVVSGLVSLLTSVAGIPEVDSDGYIYIDDEGYSIDNIDTSAVKDVVRLKVKR